MTKENRTNLLHTYLPIGAIISCVICAFYVGAKMQTLDTLNENVVAYMETYSPVRFNDIERDIIDNEARITSLESDMSDEALKKKVIGFVEDEFFELTN